MPEIQEDQSIERLAVEQLWFAEVNSFLGGNPLALPANQLHQKMKRLVEIGDKCVSYGGTQLGNEFLVP